MIFTLAYLDRNGERWTCTRAVYRDLAHRCAQAGGRIYLAKTVEADPADMNAMWGDGVRALWAFRQRVDPHCNLTNEFWRRNFECILSPLGGAGNGVCTLAPP
jgi:FAD/FMN-containing dehydrogenase